MCLSTALPEQHRRSRSKTRSSSGPCRVRARRRKRTAVRRRSSTTSTPVYGTSSVRVSAAVQVLALLPCQNAHVWPSLSRLLLARVGWGGRAGDWVVLGGDQREQLVAEPNGLAAQLDGSDLAVLNLGRRLDLVGWFGRRPGPGDKTGGACPAASWSSVPSPGPPRAPGHPDAVRRGDFRLSRNSGNCRRGSPRTATSSIASAIGRRPAQRLHEHTRFQRRNRGPTWPH